MKNLFEGFEGREENLKKIYRFSMFEKFTHRNHLWTHEQRVAYIIKDLFPSIKITLPKADRKKAFTLALVHDDAEVLTGDVQFGHKIHMTQEQLKKLDDEEEKAVNKLAKKYPQKINDYSYKDLLMSAVHKDTLEAQIVSYADKMDAYCEAIHELFSGNLTALRPVLGYERTLFTFSSKFPKLRPFLSHKDSVWTNFTQRTNPEIVKLKYYDHLFKNHTKESIKKKTDFPTYDKWKEITVKNFPNGEELLIKKR